LSGREVANKPAKYSGNLQQPESVRELVGRLISKVTIFIKTEQELADLTQTVKIQLPYLSSGPLAFLIVVSDNPKLHDTPIHLIWWREITKQQSSFRHWAKRWSRPSNTKDKEIRLRVDSCISTAEERNFIADRWVLLTGNQRIVFQW